jgi:hypothetical protein
MRYCRLQELLWDDVATWRRLEQILESNKYLERVVLNGIDQAGTKVLERYLQDNELLQEAKFSLLRDCVDPAPILSGLVPHPNIRSVHVANADLSVQATMAIKHLFQDNTYVESVAFQLAREKDNHNLLESMLAEEEEQRLVWKQRLSTDGIPTIHVERPSSEGNTVASREARAALTEADGVLPRSSMDSFLIPRYGRRIVTGASR